MKLQLIQFKASPSSGFPNITVSTLNSPCSLDEFDVNIIDLSSPDIWNNKGSDCTSVNCVEDFKSLKIMADKRKKSTVLYALPQNLQFYYNYNYGKYNNCTEIKNVIPNITNFVFSKLFPSNFPNFQLIFEPTKTDVNGFTYNADFYFEAGCTKLTYSSLSNKITTIGVTDKRTYVTTLKITESAKKLNDYINTLFSVENGEEVPEWMENLMFFDDEIQQSIISENTQLILEAGQKVASAKSKLAENARYKSILYTTGNELVEVVFDILERVLDYDLSNFIDDKHEDFLIKKGNLTFIGEIKGVSTNVRNGYISQIDHHYYDYLDRLHDEHVVEDVHQLLIINPFRNKPPIERDPIHSDQIAFAKRNGCLIICTETLISVFELFEKGSLTTEACIEVFSTHTGLLSLSDFD